MKMGHVRWSFKCLFNRSEPLATIQWRHWACTTTHGPKGSKSEIFDVFLQNGCEMGVNTQYTPKYTVAILMEHVGNMR